MTELFQAPAAETDGKASAAPLKVDLPEAEPPKPEAPAPEPEKPSEPPTVEEQLKELQDRVEKAEHRADSAEGHLRSGGSAELTEMSSEIKRLAREFRRGEIDRLPEEQQSVPLAALEAEEETAAKAAEFSRHSIRMSGRINKRLDVTGLGLDDDRVKAIHTRWGQIKTVDQIDDVVDEVDALVDTVMQERVAEATPKPRVPQNQGVPVGAAAQTDQAWLDQYADETDTEIPLDPANAAKAKEMMAKGMTPKPR